MGQRGILATNFGLRKGLRKCEKIEQPLKDFISELPNEILVHILSFLTLKESARTSVLSKRWIYLWLYVTQLDFDGSKILDKLAAIANTSKHSSSRKSERCKFVQWVDKVLQSHNALALDEFRVCFDLDKSSQNEIDKWLQYAFAKKVRRLELDLLEYGEILCSSTKAYTIFFGSLGLSSGKTSQKSHSGCCGSHPRASIDFKSLRTLSLMSVNVAGELLEFFLQKCPFLKRLVVQGSHDLISLEVSGPSLALQHLEITHCYKLKSLTVRDTNLVSLKITEAQTLMLANVPKLVDVYVSGRSKDLVRDVISWLSCCLLKLEVLTVYASVFQGNTKLHELPQLTKLKQLTLITRVSEDVSLIGFTSLIRASPNLEKFVLKLQWNDDVVRGNRKSEKAVSVPLQHLKVVELSGYYGRQSDLELVEYFIENEVSLEKIIINPRNQPVFRRRRVQTSREIRKERDARNYAKQQLEGLIPSHIELVIC